MKIHLDPCGQHLKVEFDGKELPVMAVEVVARANWATRVTLEMAVVEVEIEGEPGEIGSRTRVK